MLRATIPLSWPPRSRDHTTGDSPVPQSPRPHSNEPTRTPLAPPSSARLPAASPCVPPTLWGPLSWEGGTHEAACAVATVSGSAGILIPTEEIDSSDRTDSGTRPRYREVGRDGAGGALTPGLTQLAQGCCGPCCSPGGEEGRVLKSRARDHSWNHCPVGTAVGSEPLSGRTRRRVPSRSRGHLCPGASQPRTFPGADRGSGGPSCPHGPSAHTEMTLLSLFPKFPGTPEAQIPSRNPHLQVGAAPPGWRHVLFGPNYRTPRTVPRAWLERAPRHGRSCSVDQREPPCRHHRVRGRCCPTAPPGTAALHCDSDSHPSGGSCGRVPAVGAPSSAYLKGH